MLTTKHKQKIYKDYIEKTIQKRIEKRITQQNLAKLCGISPKYIGMIETYKRIPSLEVMLSMMVNLDIKKSTVNQLIKELSHNLK